MNDIVGGKYQLGQRLGWGSYGEVFASGPYAVKRCKFIDSKNNSQSESIINQIRFLARLRHPNIVEMHEIILEDDALCIVMQKCESDLDKFITRNVHNKRCCTEQQTFQIARQIVKGYKELIRNKIVHRDLKPANILLNNGIIKIADFGIARLVDRQNERLLSTHVGTVAYMAPQVIQKVNYSRKCDVWSLGVILYQLLFSRRPWYGRSQEEILHNILTHSLWFPRRVNESTKRLIEEMLTISEDSRIGWQQLENRVMIKQKEFSCQVGRKMIELQAKWLSTRKFHLAYTSLSVEQKNQIHLELFQVIKPSSFYLLNFLE